MPVPKNDRDRCHQPGDALVNEAKRGLYDECDAKHAAETP